MDLAITARVGRIEGDLNGGTILIKTSPGTDLLD